ncbi:MAG: 4-hydroxy-tetrahydrodipicolinate synthase [Clostridium sp.]|nr:4-hydroxy-tetrahydrodipicolinate synthase [Clostridium sp.]
MNTIDLNGLGVALITPFTADGTQIDIPALERHVERMIASGANYLLALGTTAEPPTLTPAERLRVRDVVAGVNAGRVPLLLGCGGNSTAEIVDELRSLDPRGYDAILSVVPYYNKPSQRGLIGHFGAIAQASPLPVVLYNIPGRTGVNMLPDTTLEIVRQNPSIIAIKEASGIMSQFNRLINESPEEFAVISGDDALAFAVTASGGQGVISVLGNAFPGEFSTMLRLLREGNLAEARKIHRRFIPLYSLLFTEGNPAGIKSLLSQMGYCSGALRLPLTPVSEVTAGKIHAELEKIFLESR